MMWANLGYPPCSHVVAVQLNNIPEEAGPSLSENGGVYSLMGLDADELKALVFPITRGSGQRYIDLDAVREISDEQFKISLEEYAKARK